MEQRDNPTPTGDHLAQWQTDIPKWVAYDLALIKRDDGWGSRTDTKDSLSHWSRTFPTSNLKCFKVQGVMNCKPEALADLLCTNLLRMPCCSFVFLIQTARQKEWHELFIRGQLLEENKDAKCWVYKMIYSSGSKLVADRWCQYLLKYTLLDDGFILTYRSVLHKDCPPEKSAERTDLLVASHCVQDLKNGTCLLTSLQQATPGGSVPNFLSNMMQVDIILGELRKTRQVVGPQK